MLRIILFCIGGALLYSFLYILDIASIFISPAYSRIMLVLGGIIIGAAFLWGLAQYAQLVGRRTTVLVLALANPFSWLALLLLFIAGAAWMSGPDDMNLGAAIGAVALAFALFYIAWLALTWLFLRDAKLAALFGGLSGGAFATFSWGLWSGLLLLADALQLDVQAASGRSFGLGMVLVALVAALAFYLGWPRPAGR